MRDAQIPRIILDLSNSSKALLDLIRGYFLFAQNFRALQTVGILRSNCYLISIEYWNPPRQLFPCRCQFPEPLLCLA